MNRDYTFYVYILTNPDKTTLYIGMTNSLKRRLFGHYKQADNSTTFTARYSCYILVYYEVYQYVDTVSYTHLTLPTTPYV